MSQLNDPFPRLLRQPVKRKTSKAKSGEQQQAWNIGQITEISEKSNHQNKQQNSWGITEISEEKENQNSHLNRKMRRSEQMTTKHAEYPGNIQINGVNKKHKTEGSWEISEIKEKTVPESEWKINGIQESTEKQNWRIHGVQEKPKWKIEEIEENNNEERTWKINKVNQEEVEINNWKINGVEELKEENTPKWTIEKIDKDVTKNWQIKSIEEKNQENAWTIRSVKSIEEQEEPSQIQGVWEIRSVHSEQTRVDEPPKLEEHWSVYEVEEKQEDVKSTCGSIIMEESWEELHHKPIPVIQNIKENRKIVSTHVSKPVAPVTIDYKPPVSSTTMQVNRSETVQKTKKNKKIVSAQIKNREKAIPVVIDYQKPISSTTVQTNTVKPQKKESSITVRRHDSVKSKLSRCSSVSSVYMEDSWTEYNKVPVSNWKVEMDINQDRRMPALDLADHYQYQYASKNKTERLNSIRSRHDMSEYSGYNSTRPISSGSTKPPYVPETEGLKQNINVEHNEEELIDGSCVPTMDAAGNKLILQHGKYGVVSVQAVEERVRVLVWPESKAAVEIVISVEMYHNLKRMAKNDEKWHRKEVVLTRTIELDLTRVQGSKKLQDVLRTCKATRPQLTSKEGVKSNHPLEYKSESQLTGHETLQLFRELMRITEDEEDRYEIEQMDRGNYVSAGKQPYYVTKSPGGQLTSVACEPEYLKIAADNGPIGHCLLY